VVEAEEEAEAEAEAEEVVNFGLRVRPNRLGPVCEAQPAEKQV